ncbi:MAG TPA: CcdB family protein [Luteimonas sp.]|nr:CcdB family protein [Luteimonas sp.]HRP71684.1 CcdB family protein [Luteimonas sp.]
MTQFVVYANADAASRKSIPSWLNVQSDLIETADSRVVIPMVTPERAGSIIQRLMPELVVAGKRMVMDTAQITNVPLQMLGKPVADLSDDRLVIIDAIDMLTHGI